jgi:hypothetical protein
MLIPPSMPISIHLLAIDRLADRILHEADDRFALDQEMVNWMCPLTVSGISWNSHRPLAICSNSHSIIGIRWDTGITSKWYITGTTKVGSKVGSMVGFVNLWKSASALFHIRIDRSVGGLRKPSPSQMGVYTQIRREAWMAQAIHVKRCMPSGGMHRVVDGEFHQR